MDISHKRMEQIKEANKGKHQLLLDTAADIFEKQADPTAEDSVTQFVRWLATDPTPAALTVADLDEADRLGYALATAAPYIQQIAATWYFTKREDAHFKSRRNHFNSRAAAVVTELRAIMRERGDVVVKRNPVINDAMVAAYHRGHRSKSGHPTERERAGIAAVIDHYTEREVQP